MVGDYKDSNFAEVMNMANKNIDESFEEGKRRILTEKLSKK